MQRGQQGTIATEGAELYYESCGEGPPVLIIQGGVGEAGATAQLAEALAQHYRVISYDRRGLSRSPASVEAPPIAMSLHAADAAALLTAVCREPARVVGASIGALIGLHLAVQHPELVATLVAHEPPMSAVVHDPAQEAALDRVADLARDDVRAAIRHMASLTGNGQAVAEEGARPAPPVGDIDATLSHFFHHDFPAVRAATLDAAQIAAVAGSTTIIPTGGTASRGQWEYRCAAHLAHELSRTLIELPGGHNGLISHPWATAAELRRLFTQAESS